MDLAEGLRNKTRRAGSREFSRGYRLELPDRHEKTSGAVVRTQSTTDIYRRYFSSIGDRDPDGSSTPQLAQLGS